MIKLLSTVGAAAIFAFSSGASAGDVSDLERMVRIRYFADACEIALKDDTARWVESMIERSPPNEVDEMEATAPDIFRWYVEKEGYAGYCFQLRQALIQLGWLD